MSARYTPAEKQQVNAMYRRAAQGRYEATIGKIRREIEYSRATENIKEDLTNTLEDIGLMAPTARPEIVKKAFRDIKKTVKDFGLGRKLLGLKKTEGSKLEKTLSKFTTAILSIFFLTGLFLLTVSTPTSYAIFNVETGSNSVYLLGLIVAIITGLVLFLHMHGFLAIGNYTEVKAKKK